MESQIEKVQTTPSTNSQNDLSDKYKQTKDSAYNSDRFIFEEHNPSIVNYLQSNMNGQRSNDSSVMRSRISEIIFTYSTHLYEDEMKTIKDLNEEDYIPNSKIIEPIDNKSNIENNEKCTVEKRTTTKKSTFADMQSKKSIESSKVLIESENNHEEVYTFKLEQNLKSAQKYLKAFCRFAKNQGFEIIDEQSQYATIKKNSPKSVGQILAGCLFAMRAIMVELRYEPNSNELKLNLLEGFRSEAEPYLNSIKKILWGIGGIEYRATDRLLIFLNQETQAFQGFNKSCRQNYRRAINKESELEKCVHSGLHLKNLLISKMRLSGFQLNSQPQGLFEIEVNVLNNTCLWEMYRAQYSKDDREFEIKRKAIRQKLTIKQCCQALKLKESYIQDECWAQATKELTTVEKFRDPLNKMQAFQKFLDTLIGIQKQIDTSQSNSAAQGSDLLALVVLAFLHCQTSQIRSSIKYVEAYASIKQLDTDYSNMAKLNLSLDYIQDCWSL